MKKMFLIALILCLLPCMSVSSSALAENSIDISRMSIEELLSLKDEITAELYTRGKGVFLPKGEYVCGQDIAPGSYIITFFENDSNLSNVTITVFNSPKAKVQYDGAYEDYQLKWDILEETILSGSSVSIEVPDTFDASQYYESHYEEFCHAGDAIRIHISEGQMLSVEYDGRSLYALIEQAKGVFME